MLIAILEDDVEQATLLNDWLTQEGHTCQIFAQGSDYIRALGRETFDLSVIDWGLPDMSGLDVLSRARAGSDEMSPVLFVTNRDSEDDIVRALKSGADDYMVKPVRRNELVARVEAITRRAFKGHNDPLLNIPPYVLEQSSYCVHFNNETVQLTAKEFELALLFFKNKGRLLSRSYIMESIWRQRPDLNTRTIDTHISALRQKLRLKPDNGWKLATVYKHGYRLQSIDKRAQ